MTRPESNEEWVLTPLDGVPRRPYTGMWATYLCDWYLDWSSCCMGTLWPYLQFYYNIDDMNMGNGAIWGAILFTLCLMVGFLVVATDGFWARFIALAIPMIGAAFRTKLRERLAIPGTRLGDLATWIVCPCCSLTQEARQIGGFVAASRDAAV